MTVTAMALLWAVTPALYANDGQASVLPAGSANVSLATMEIRSRAPAARAELEGRARQRDDHYPNDIRRSGYRTLAEAGDARACDDLRSHLYFQGVRGLAPGDYGRACYPRTVTNDRQRAGQSVWFARTSRWT